jgi:hypothetical protein
LSVLEARPRHGYDLSKLIQARSGGPLLYLLEERGWIEGTRVGKPGERRGRFYKVMRCVRGGRSAGDGRRTCLTGHEKSALDCHL